MQIKLDRGKNKPTHERKRWSTVYNVAGVKLKRRGVISFLSHVCRKANQQIAFQQTKSSGWGRVIGPLTNGQQQQQKKKKQQVDWLMIFNYPVDIFFCGGEMMKRRTRCGVCARALSTGQQEKIFCRVSAHASPPHTTTWATTPLPPLQLLEVGAGPNKIWEGFISVIMHSPPIPSNRGKKFWKGGAGRVTATG